ncbi:MAG: hypothetical protein UV63_C0033G0021 [Microgenomates group bacterium GW2011_GWC1_43_11]|uniref:Ribbon-helix-helix protein CopG domain-containing protein n=2 Tax=Candidatus Gottesmaniibacteriota TaxID=1752720 RepID=A0A0G1KX08_9BACT|nr:MAG: hypothetical protein UV63_C0033G0021 [Microgenomates group bacterium GW2011_GWC1_43_11]KKT38126.1 MAG: hypothetical protein UW22_C0013G0013 [Candidatus Gottesmanbacteria bacterium GW2011_GWB1_44_11c]KKT60857.1 MAG: hypothetical protein UW52_C0016G0004 [Candidatus Gottesmanbacteria bacterium GW2011_GWA1_44_24b]HCM82392.1 hypothetical protein [Patescibacteria group bacterium]
MIRTQVYLPDELHHQLVFAAQQRGVRYAELIREGVARVLSNDQYSPDKKAKKMSFIGAGAKGGDAKLSSHIDAIIYE